VVEAETVGVLLETAFPVLTDVPPDAHVSGLGPHSEKATIPLQVVMPPTVTVAESLTDTMLPGAGIAVGIVTAVCGVAVVVMLELVTVKHSPASAAPLCVAFGTPVVVELKSARQQ
jgi:hypothetical protein